jgi:diaminopimelate decarboxylase
MSELLRPNLYGAQHPIELSSPDGNAGRALQDYLIAGHCCESSDVLTPEPGNPEGLLARSLPTALPGDTIIIGGAGAYCSALAGKNYNSFPEAPEVLVRTNGELVTLRKRQMLDQMLQNEILT